MTWATIQTYELPDGIIGHRTFNTSRIISVLTDGPHTNGMNRIWLDGAKEPICPTEEGVIQLRRIFELEDAERGQ